MKKNEQERETSLQEGEEQAKRRENEAKEKERIQEERKIASAKIILIVLLVVLSVIGAAGYVFHWGDTPEIALATSVLYLIPGIPYINSVSDLLDGHYISSFGRFMNALVLTACLSAGLCGGLLLMNINWL